MSNNNTNKMDIPSTISAGAGAIGSLFGLFTQNKANKDNMRFQRQENERNRNFQREMADYAYQKNLEQWNRENEYNSPIETRKRLKNAGLNPDLFYGGGAGNMVSADSPMMSAPSGTGGVSPAVRPISADTHALDLEMRRAQIDNIKSQTRQNDADATLGEIDALTRDALNRGQIEVNGVTVVLGKAKENWTKTDEERIKASVDEINANTSLIQKREDEIRSRIANMDADTLYKSIQNYYASEMFEAQIRDYQASVNQKNASATLSYTQARDILKTQVARVALLEEQVKTEEARRFTEWAKQDVYDAAGVKLSWETGNLKITNSWLPSLYGAQIAGTTTNALAETLSGYLSYLEYANPLRIVHEDFSTKTEYDKYGAPGRTTVIDRVDKKTGMRKRRVR